MSEQVHVSPSYGEFLQHLGDIKTFMLAILGDGTQHDNLHEIGDARRDHLICGMIGAFEGLVQKKHWFKRYAENWVKLMDLKNDVELREMYSQWTTAGMEK